MLSSMMLAAIPDVAFESVYDDKEDAPRFLTELEKLGVKAAAVPRWIVKKTHNANDINQSDKVLFLVRDGRDAMVSYCKFCEKKNSRQKTDYIRFWNTLTGQPHDGVNSMWHNFNRYSREKLSSVQHLTVQYEQLVTQPAAALSQVAEFIGAEIVQSRLDLVSFDRLHVINPNFYRKGTIGSSIEAGPQALKWLMPHIRSELGKLGYLTESFAMGAGI